METSHPPGAEDPYADRHPGDFCEDRRLSVAWGILSTAAINREILAGARASEDVRVIAVASRDRARADAYARAQSVERAYGSYAELLRDRDVEAVYISLPNALHVEWSVRALEAGKHVLCEKPLARRSEDVERAFDAAERAGRLLMEGFMYRHHPQTRKITELVAGGAIGRLALIRTTFSFALVDERNIRLHADLDGGALMDLGCYCVNGSRLLAGEPERVYGEQVLAADGVDLSFHGTMRFANDVVAQFDASFAVPGRQRLEAVGDEGVLASEAPWRVDWGSDLVLRRGDAVERVDVEEADSYRLELENLSAAIRGDGAPLLGRDDALGQARALEALYRSADERTAVMLGS